MLPVVTLDRSWCSAPPHPAGCLRVVSARPDMLHRLGLALAGWLLAQTLCAEPVLSPSERETIARRGVARAPDAAADAAAAASAGWLEELGVNSAFPVRVRAAAPPRALQPALEPGRSVLWAPPPPPESDLNPPSGECVDGVCRDGVGKFIWASGDQYEGEWDEKSRPHGRGVYQWHDGESYDGDWVHGLKEGTGVYIYANGAAFTGKWKNDIQFGENNNYADAYGTDYMIDIPEDFPPDDYTPPP